MNFAFFCYTVKLKRLFLQIYFKISKKQKRKSFESLLMIIFHVVHRSSLSDRYSWLSVLVFPSPVVSFSLVHYSF